MKYKPLDIKDFEVNEILELSENQLQITITGINQFTNSEIREILFDAFNNKKPMNKEY